MTHRSVEEFSVHVDEHVSNAISSDVRLCYDKLGIAHNYIANEKIIFLTRV